jgi:renal tumor antigen
MRKYRIVSRTGEGRFATVVKAQHTKTKELFAIKCMKSSYESAEQVGSLREIQAIKRLSPHPNIVKLEEVLFDPPSGRLALVFELLEGNLYQLMKGRSEMFSKDEVKSFMRQIFTAITHMHSKGVFHRDIKPENILFDKSGKRLKLADFGSCRGMNGKPPFTEHIATRWYRPPEVLLTSGMYGPEMDVWGAGCILFELTTLHPLFPGTDKADMINRIHKVLGTPSESVIAKLKPHASNQLIFTRQEGIGLKRLLPDAAPECLDLLTQTIAYDKTVRITSKKAMKHSYFGQQTPRSAPRLSNAAGFNQLSNNQTAAILGFLDYKNIMRSRMVSKKFRDAAKKTIVPVYDQDRYQYLNFTHLVGEWLVVG